MSRRPMAVPRCRSIRITWMAAVCGSVAIAGHGHLPGRGDRDLVQGAGVRHLFRTAAESDQGVEQVAVSCPRRIHRRGQPGLRPAPADRELCRRSVSTEMAAAPHLRGLAAPVPQKERAGQGGQDQSPNDQAFPGGERGHGCCG
jgi:hypothetical protein